MIENLPVIQDSDVGFDGFASRPDPLILPRNKAQMAENMRFNRGRAETRKGILRVADDISPANPPLTIPFLLNDASPPVVRNSYTGGIFAACSIRLAGWQDGKEYIAMAGDAKLWLYSAGEAVATVDYPVGETFETTDKVKMLQAYDRLYVFREAARVGLYADHVLGAGAVTRSGTTVTVTSVAHGLMAGMRVRIDGADQAAYNAEFDVATVPDPDSFTITVLHDPVTPGTGTIRWRRVKAPLYWDGVAAALVRAPGGSNAAGATFSTLRACSVAAYFNNQLVIAPAPAWDEVLISDVLDADTFDPLLKSFRANAGSSDFIVTLHPYAESDILVFMRSSIYRARIVVANNGVDINPTESFIELLTDELGCVARDTVVTAGEFVYFMSDTGVHRLSSNFADLKLRGLTLPLSDTIANLFDDLDTNAIGTSNAVWFDNRYWLAIPTNNAGVPNALLVYNVLNDSWESKDSFPTQIHSLVVATYNGQRRLFGVSIVGKLFLLDEREDGDDVNTPGIDAVPINSKLVTRRYNYGDSLPKRFLRCVASLEMMDNSKVEVDVRTYEPDGSTRVGGLELAERNDVVLKMPMRVSGTSAEAEIRTVRGRSIVRTVAMEVTAARPGTTTLNQK